eukprot:GILI01015687.1.p1 GENE.GILI01015687.1~~GILI01015687.1.p1  ORF type:complete len:222 (-),score=63.08 GILI01015687.1:117-782(-)
MASGGSVLAIKYEGGVLLATDTLLSYGSLAKWPNIPRIKIIGKRTAIAASGDYADFQEVAGELEKLVASDSIALDGYDKTPSDLFCYLHRTLYSKRSDFEPALCHFMLVGVDPDGKSILGSVDDVGTKYLVDFAATGFGQQIALPILRRTAEGKNGKVSRADALACLKECLKLLFYRDCRAANKFQVADATDGNVVISEPFSVETEWEFEGFSFAKTAIIR